MALGFCQHNLGEVKKALDNYHKAHFMKKEDSMIEQMVARAL